MNPEEIVETNQKLIILELIIDNLITWISLSCWQITLGWLSFMTRLLTFLISFLLYLRGEFFEFQINVRLYISGLMLCFSLLNLRYSLHNRFALLPYFLSNIITVDPSHPFRYGNKHRLSSLLFWKISITPDILKECLSISTPWICRIYESYVQTRQPRESCPSEDYG